MKKSAKKVKAVKRSKSSEPETQMPDLVAVMLKLTERLEAVERKMDLVISQTSNNRPAFQQNPPRPQHVQQPAPQHNQNQFSQPRPQQFNQPRPEQNFNRAPQQQQHPQNQNQKRQGGKPMFQAVCADCKKSCEVPFRPSGERPTYCKECYSLRKNIGKPSQPQQSGSPSGFPVMEKRQLKVVSNGVGRTVISEMVPAAPRAAAPVKKVSKPAKKGEK